MHYALCKNTAFSLRPMLGPLRSLCSIRFMQYERMHYEKVNCSPDYVSSIQKELSYRKQAGIRINEQRMDCTTCSNTPPQSLRSSHAEIKDKVNQKECAK